MNKLTKSQRRVMAYLKTNDKMIIVQNLYTLQPTVTDQKPEGFRYVFKRSTLIALDRKGVIERMMDFKWKLSNK